MTFLFMNTVAPIWSAVWPYLLAILLFGVIIAIHEVGHFLFAKLFDVKVNEFALGMGPVIFKRQKGETKYALRLFPIGGFVSMEGEDEDSDDDRAFFRKPCWQRFIIVAAGAILNLILGVIVVAIVLSADNLIGTKTINGFFEDSVSSNYGLMEGDEILEINGTKIYSYRGIGFNLVRDDDNSVDFKVRRDGQVIDVNGVEFDTFEYEGRDYIVWDFQLIGVEPSFLKVVKTAVLDSASIVQLVRLSLVDMVSGKYGLKDISGPIGTISAIADTTAQAKTVKEKMLTALELLSYITINVGVFNLLPVPALDGGRLFFIAIEAIRRKPISRKYEGYIHAAGLIMLLLLMVVVTVSDIVKKF
ncbi:MAG TPA: M50 family metallopeptidase [Oscillospiraceae bacterium]|nr:M50 family metallopeptidase [Oscillospiraceae bacterium]